MLSQTILERATLAATAAQCCLTSAMALDTGEAVAEARRLRFLAEAHRHRLALNEALDELAKGNVVSISRPNPGPEAA